MAVRSERAERARTADRRAVDADGWLRVGAGGWFGG